MRGVDSSPPRLRGLDEFERHRDPGGAGAGALGDALPEPHGGEGRLDRVRNRYEDLGAAGSVDSVPSLVVRGGSAYGATVRDRGAGSEAGWAGRCCSVG